MSEILQETIYVLTNESLPDLVKIGRTERSVEERIVELSSASGVPTPFRVFRTFAVPDSADAEARIHERLRESRVADNREFFRIDPDWACVIIDEMFPQDSSHTAVDDGVAGDGVLQFRAKNLRSRYSHIWPGLLASELGISYGDAVALFDILKNQHVITDTGDWTPEFAPLPSPSMLDPTLRMTGISQTPVKQGPSVSGIIAIIVVMLIAGCVGLF